MDFVEDYISVIKIQEYEMPYITEKKLKEAQDFIKTINDAIALLTDDEMIYRLRNMEQYIAYSAMLKLKTPSKKHKNNGVLCERCDCVVVKLEEHQKTEKCRLSYERKGWSKEKEVVEDYETKKVVDTYNQKKLAKEIFKEKIAKKIKKQGGLLSKTARAELEKWIEKILKKKENGIPLSKTYTLKQYKDEKKVEYEANRLQRELREKQIEAEAKKMLMKKTEQKDEVVVIKRKSKKLN